MIGINTVTTEFFNTATYFVINNLVSVDIETVTAASIEDIALAERSFSLLASQATYGNDAHTIRNRALEAHATNLRNSRATEEPWTVRP